MKAQDTTLSVHSYVMNSLAGEPVSLSTYKGKVMLIVNVASQCGYTPQYDELQALWEQYGDSGLVILGFPANEFGSQEPGSSEEISSFCKKNYGVTFPMFEKIVVKGDDIHPLYQYLTEKKNNGILDAEVKWNFQKFLIDRNGNLVEFFLPKVKPSSDAMMEAVNRELNKH